MPPPKKVKVNLPIKPPYIVPSMVVINQIPFNGYKVVSTFSGCGGSCLGYRMAGFKVVWANEFLPKARESYHANFPDTILDGRSIVDIQPREILDAIGLRCGELDLFDGSPPCQAFSIAGKREKNWGKAKKYENGAEQCNENMFFEYIRLLNGLQPRVFIAENVKGLTIGSAKKMMGSFQDDMFDDQSNTILRQLINCGYNVEYRVLNAANYGVPQNRIRVIFQGIRKDLKLKPVWPKPLKWVYSIIDACPWLDSNFKQQQGAFNANVSCKRPIPTILASQHNQFKITYRAGGYSENSKNIQINSNKPINTLTAQNSNFKVLVEGYSPNIKPNKPGNNFSRNNLKSLDLPVNSITCQKSNINGSPAAIKDGDKYRKLTIEEAKRLGSFPDDFILVGTYANQWERIGNSVAPVFMKHIARTIRDEILNRLPKQPINEPRAVAAPSRNTVKRLPPPKSKLKFNLNNYWKDRGFCGTQKLTDSIKI